MKTLKQYYNEKPLQVILVVALIFRLLAAFFAKGYGMHDDHFLIIESSASFTDGTDYMNWLPPKNIPNGHSFFYLGLHYLLFLFLKAIHCTSPDIQMYIVRIIHAFYSLSIIYFGYKIVLKYASQKLANYTAWLLALFWFMPWLSVRNLVEFQCIPFLLWGTWQYLKHDTVRTKNVIISGILIGIAFSIRFQTIFFIVGFGLTLLCLKQFKNAIIWGITCLAVMAVVQGGIDLFVWGRPFVELQEYIRYNFYQSGDYPQGGFFKYFIVILGMLIPPISVFLFCGFFVCWKKHLLLFLPSFVFLLFHSIFPNKQERFIFTIIPFIIILGMMGWNILRNKYLHKKIVPKFEKGSWLFFIIVNTLLLCVVTFHYSKKARVEAMLYIGQYKNWEYVMYEDKVPALPSYYSGKWFKKQRFSAENMNQVAANFNKQYPNHSPEFFILVDNKDLNTNLDSLRVYYPSIKFETKVYPNYIDKMLYKINPKNNNETLAIYSNEDAILTKK